MAETIDSLEIEISAKATKANNALDNLVTKLETLSSTLGRLKTDNLTNLANGVSSLSTAMQGMQNVKKADYNRIAKGLDKIATVNAGNLETVSNALNPLATSLQELSNVNFDNRNINNVINCITRLANSNVGNLQGLDQLSASLRGLIDNIAGAGNVERTTSSLVNGIARLANAGGSAMLTANALPALSLSLKNLITDLSTAPVVSAEITDLTTAIAKLASAGSKTAVTASHLEELSNKLLLFMKSLENAPRISENTIRLVTAIANLASAGSNANRAFGNIANFGKRGFSAINSLSNAFKNLIPNMKNATKTSKGFVSQIGMFYAKCFLVIRAFKQLGKAITGASDYIEEFNYFNVAMTKIADENKKNYKQYGYDDAESYAESFKTRLTELTGKMSGFNIDKSGELSNSGMQNLGLDVKEIMNFESRVAQITNSVGMLGEASVASSKALTMLSGDLSSLANVDLQQVMDNLSSGMTGMTAAVKKYGMDISVASLKQYALNLGIKKNISDMTQAEKMYLRVIAMLDQSKVAWGDLANTINQPANQFRMLKNNIKATGMMIGKLFMPMVSAVLPWINAMTMAIKDLVQWIGDLFGIKWDNNSIAAPDDSGWSDLEEDVSDTANSIDKATDAQKKFNKQLMGFDELNNISKNEKDSTDGNKNGANNSDVSGVLSDALINAVEEYEKRWNKAFDGMTSKADELKQKIEEVFKADWKTGDFTDVGATLGTWIKNGLDGIPWDTLQDGFQKVGKSIGTAINGFVKVEGLGETLGTSIANGVDTFITGINSFFTTTDFDAIGKFIASGVNGSIKTDLFKDMGSLLGNKLNAVFQTLDGFSKELKWDKMGETIVTSLNSFFDTFDIGKAGLSLGNFTSGITTSLYTAVSDTETWSKLGKKIGDGINGFFENMNMENANNGMNGWQELGKSISETITGMATSISTALESVDWLEVGQAIGDFISSIDFGKVAWNLAEMANSLLGAICDAIAGITEKAPIETAIAALFAGLTLTGVTGNLAKGLTATLASQGLTLGKVAIGLGLGLATFKFIESDDKVANLVLAPLTAFLATFTFTKDIKLGLKIAAVTFAFEAGFNIGKEIGKALFGTDTDWFLTDYSPNEWLQAFYDACLDFDLPGKISKLWVKVTEPIAGWVSSFAKAGRDMLDGLIKGLCNIGNSIVEFGESIVNAVKNFFGIHSPSKVFEELGDYCIQGFINGIKSIGDKIKTTLSNAWNTVTAWWNENVKLPDINIPTIGDIKTALSNAWNDTVLWWNSVKDTLPSIKIPSIGSIKAAISEKWSDAKEWWKEAKDGLKDIKLPSIGSIKAIISDKWKDAKEWWKEAKDNLPDIKVPSIGSIKEKIKSIWENAVEWWNGVRGNLASIKVPSFGDIVSTIKSAWSKAKKWWKDNAKLPKISLKFNFSVEAMKSAINTIIGWINKYIIKSLNKISIKIPKIEVAGRELFGGKTIGFNVDEIQGFANGGFPQTADIFYANENGKPEMIGRIGSRTAVANNDQIVSAVSDGVFNALAPVLTSVANAISNSNSSGTPLYVEGLSDGDIVRITTDANNSHKKRYGTPLYT